MASEGRMVSRRNFTKGVGIGMVALPFAIPQIANAAGGMPQGETDAALDCAVASLIPMAGEGSQLVFGKETVKFYKNNADLARDRALELSGMAATVVQLCQGKAGVDDIASAVADIYKVDPESIRDGVARFVKYLFNEGYLCFVSEKKLADREKKTRRGITVRGTKNPKLAVLAKKDQKTNLEF